ncbi:MAG TPA: hypothetical protein VG935_00420, partial [Patescibacteria group bacterium]|nr:hypothetical protein [Patescibacteria group bacterium]
VLSLDNQNPIAIRNLKRLSGGVSNTKAVAFSPSYVSNLFIEEPGKTKVVELLNAADKKVIAPLRSGEALQLTIKRMKVFLLDQNKQYIGMLPDDIGRRLIRFMGGGNTYEAYIKSVDGNKVTIFARETKRAVRFKNQPSFLPTERPKLFNTHQSHQDKRMQARANDLEDQENTEEETSQDEE